MKEILLTYLLITIFSFEQEFGNEIPFDINNNNTFEFIFVKDGSLFIRVDFPKSNILILNIESYEEIVSESSEISPPGKTTVIPFKKGKPFKISLLYKSSSNEKGVIWMFPSIYEIKINIRKTYEWKYDYKATRKHCIDSYLHYSIDKAEKDAILEFKYNNNLLIYQDFIAPNPLELYEDNYRRTGITTYQIKMGNSYKILIPVKYKTIYATSFIHFLPSFSFHFIYEKRIEPEYGKEISFDINNNNAFETIFSEDGSLFIRIDFDTSDLLVIIIKNSYDGFYNKAIEQPGLQTVIPFKKDVYIEILLEYKYKDRNEKGIIWMLPSTNEIKVNLYQTYEFKYDFKGICNHQISSHLVYSIDNAEKDAILEFKYNDKLILDKNIKVSNPLEILDGKKNIVNITNYDINKGKSYKIYINTKIFLLNKEIPEYLHYIPNFSFNFIYIEKEPEFGKEISFDINNANTFKLIFPEDGGLFIRTNFSISNILYLNISSYIFNFNEIINPPGLLHIIPFQKDKPILIRLLYQSYINEKGIIWMYPTTKEIKVKFNKTYEFKYDFKRYYNHKKIFRLIYSIDKAENDSILEFKYNNFTVYNNSIASNPLKICYKEKCETNITIYEIKKGEPYKIYINTNFIGNGPEYIHYLPSFSFNFTIKEEEKEKKEEKKDEKDLDNIFSMKIVYIILISILLIGVIGLIFFLVYRKNRKLNYDINKSNLTEIELENIEDGQDLYFTN